MITFDEIIDVVVKTNNEKTKTVSTNFNEKNITCKTQTFCILVTLLLITIELLISVSIYCYLVKYWANTYYHFTKQKRIRKVFLLIIYYQKKKKMENKNESKEISIKNHAYYYFNDIIKIEDSGINNIVIDERPYENILVYNISYKSLIDSTLLRIRFDKIDWFIRVFDQARCLVLFRSEKYDYINNRIRYLRHVKSGIRDTMSNNYAKIDAK